MSRPLPYFCWFAADAETDENFKAMSDEQVGFYLRCLNHCWINGSLPADPDEASRVMGRTRARFDRLWERVGRCFVPREGDPTRIVNPRQERERNYAQEVHSKKSDGGKKTAHKRWGSKLDSDSLATSTPTTRASGSEYRSSFKVLNKKSRTSLLTPEQAGWFELFWMAYWRRIGRGDAEKSFAACVKTEKDFCKVMQALELQSPWMLQRDSDKRPYPATWLNQKRWEDDPDVQQTVDPRTRNDLAQHNLLVAGLERRGI